jgi:alpha/beta superfamily hydrolase
VARSESFDFAGPAGNLEAVLMHTDGPAVAAGVVCHAHPLHGGVMHFKVVFRAARALRDNGVAALRFNFRGVGRSEGTHDSGVGEQDDVAAALGELELRYPGLPVVVGGFSFGAAMALRVAARDPRPRAAFALGFPLARPEARDGFLSLVRVPVLFLQGGRDEFGAGEEIEAVAATLPSPATAEVVEGSNHFFDGHLDAVESSLGGWIAARPWNGAA